MIAEKYRSLSRWTRKMSELWLVNELDEKCSKQERLLIIIWILWFQVWHKYRNNNILTSLREWLIFTRRDCLSTNTFLTRWAWKSLKSRGFRHRGDYAPGDETPFIMLRANISTWPEVAGLRLWFCYLGKREYDFTIWVKTRKRFYYFW